MCLILFQLQEHPKYKLILAANRDEAYNRPTAPAHFWQDHENLLAGRDLLQLGTWLGITKSGRIAALTNYRDPAHMKPSERSRGEIVTNYLTGKESPIDFVETLQEHSQDYVGFNVIVGNPDELVYYNNIENQATTIRPGTHGLSNHFLNTPWPKVERGKQKLEEYVSQTSDIDAEELFTILADAEMAKEKSLPDTGIGLDLEKKLSPLFIHIPGYGTRCSTILTIDRNNHVTFTERTYEDGKFINDVSFEFTIE